MRIIVEGEHSPGGGNDGDGGRQQLLGRDPSITYWVTVPSLLDPGTTGKWACLSVFHIHLQRQPTAPRPPGKLLQSISLGPSATIGDNSLPHLVHQACLLSCQLGSNKLRGLQTLRDASKVPPHSVPRGRTPASSTVPRHRWSPSPDSILVTLKEQNQRHLVNRLPS